MTDRLGRTLNSRPLFVALAAILIAAPLEAQQATREIPGWGRFVDPSGKAKVEVTDSGLTITSGKNEMRAGSLGRMPRIVREIDGDFDVQAHVRGEFTEEYQTGMLIAWTSEEQYFAVKTGSDRYRVKKVGTSVMTRGVITGGAHQRRKSASNWIRLQRIGDELTSFYSDDGKNWMRSRSTSGIKFPDGTVCSFPGRLTLMLAVHNRSRNPLSVHFENLRFLEGKDVKPVKVVEDPEHTQMQQRAREAAARFETIRPKLQEALERANAINSVSRAPAVKTLRGMNARVAIRREGGIFSFGLPTGIAWISFKESNFSEFELDKLIFALSRLGVNDTRIELGKSTLDDSQRKRLLHEVPGKTRIGVHQYFDGPRPDEPQPVADRIDTVRVRALLQAGLRSNEWPANLVLRIESDMWTAGARSNDRLKETWEFSRGKVHKVISDIPQLQPPDSFVPRTVESQPCNTKDLCEELLSGRLLEVSQRKGSGEATRFVGTEYDIGDRAVMLLVDGRPVLDVRESCLFTGFPESDALAFAKLYEQLASQARAAFSAKLQK